MSNSPVILSPMLHSTQYLQHSNVKEQFQWTFRFCKSQGISWLASAYHQQKCCSKELNNKHSFRDSTWRRHHTSEHTRSNYRCECWKHSVTAKVVSAAWNVSITVGRGQLKRACNTWMGISFKIYFKLCIQVVLFCISINKLYTECQRSINHTGQCPNCIMSARVPAINQSYRSVSKFPLKAPAENWHQ
jgi:hypothetical protein